MFPSSPDLCSAFSSPAFSHLMFIFGASSLVAAVNTLPGGVFQRHRHLTALSGLHLIQSSAKFCRKTLQHQLRLALRFRSHTNKHQSRIKIIIWHDVIKNSLTPHSSNFNNPLSPTALFQELRALPCDIAAVVYCQRKGSPDVFQLLRQSFLVISPVRHLLSHRKQHNPELVQQYSVFHLAGSYRTENLLSVILSPSSIDDFDSQEIQTQQSTSSLFIPLHPTCSATTTLVNISLTFSNFRRYYQHLRHLHLPLAILPLKISFYLGLVLSPPGFSFLDPFGGGFRGAAWLV